MNGNAQISDKRMRSIRELLEIYAKLDQHNRDLVREHIAKKAAEQQPAQKPTK